jgi:8-oxo-dGTP pyrophosphatase MutT (NUDIX family)
VSATPEDRAPVGGTSSGSADDTLADIAARLPRKRVAAGALIRDDEGRLLFVLPNYKPGLEIPGGVVEDGESPRQACRREVLEEIGFDVTVGPLLVVDWVPTAGVWSDALILVFDGGVLDSTTLAAVAVTDDELDGVALLSLAEAEEHLRPAQRDRLAAAVAALADGVPRYLEHRP